LPAFVVFRVHLWINSDTRTDILTRPLPIWIFLDNLLGMGLSTASLVITPEILSLIAELDEFKGAWRALGTLAPERLLALRRVATIESIGSSTRIEGSKLSDREVARLPAEPYQDQKVRYTRRAGSRGLCGRHDNDLQPCRCNRPY
jgi:hypothetical protein